MAGASFNLLSAESASAVWREVGTRAVSQFLGPLWSHCVSIPKHHVQVEVDAKFWRLGPLLAILRPGFPPASNLQLYKHDLSRGFNESNDATNYAVLFLYLLQLLVKIQKLLLQSLVRW